MRRAFAAEGIRLDPPDFSAKGRQSDGSRVRAELFADDRLDIYVFNDADAYDRVQGDLRDAGAAPCTASGTWSSSARTRLRACTFG